MDLSTAFTHAVELVRPHVLPVALIAARITPATFLCPLFGGRAAPQTVRVAICLALALHAHVGGDVRPAMDLPDSFSVMAAFARELFCGTAIGFIGHGWSTNLRYEPGEWSFVKARRDKGLSQALKERDEMVAPFFRLGGRLRSAEKK